MKNVNRKPYAILFDDPVIQRALSSVGVFATDYETGDSFRSILWEELDYSLDILDANRGWLEFIHPKDRVHVRAAMEAVFSGKSDAFCETYRLRRPDGKYTWIQSKGKTLHVAADGKPLLYIGADYDITELKETEKRLRRSHQRERRRREEMETIGQAAAIIGSYGWGTKAVEQITGSIPNLKVEFLGTVLCKGRPQDETFAALDALADAIRDKHSKN